MESIINCILYDSLRRYHMGKRAISATIEESLIAWIDSELGESTRYRNKSHLIETALELMKQRGEK